MDKEDKESYIEPELMKLMHRFGNLFVHVTGEGKVDFRDKSRTTDTKYGMVKFIISGESGCMTPLQGYDTCALDQAIDKLLSYEVVPRKGKEDSIEEFFGWEEFVTECVRRSIKDTCGTKAYYRYRYPDPTGGDLLIVTVEPLCNAMVVGEYNAGNDCEYIGVIDDIDKPKIKSHIITVDGKDLEVFDEEMIHFRGLKYVPKKGDYLLKDPETNYYIILPQEDYSIH